MKYTTLIRHYIPCIYFITASIGILWGASAVNYTGVILLVLFTGLLFLKSTAFRMPVGLLTLIASLYFLLALADEVTDVRAAGGSTMMLLTGGLISLGLAVLMSVFLILPLELPVKAPLYNRK